MASESSSKGKRGRDEEFFTLVFFFPPSHASAAHCEGEIMIDLMSFFGMEFPKENLQQWLSQALAVILEEEEPSLVKQVFFRPPLWNQQAKELMFAREAYRRCWFEDKDPTFPDVSKLEWSKLPKDGNDEGVARVQMTTRYLESWQHIADDQSNRRKISRQEPGGLEKVFKLFDKVQKTAVESIERFRKAGGKAGVLVMATGMGKTLTMCKHVAKVLTEMRVKQENLGEFRFLFLVHRSAILSDACLTLKHLLGVESDPRKSHIPAANIFDETNHELPWTASDFKVLCSDASQNHKWNPIVEEPPKFLFAMLQSIEKHLDSGLLHPRMFHYVVMDEAHHNRAGEEGKGFERVFRYFHANLFVLGLSATPYRMDGRNVMELFDEKNFDEKNIQKKIPGYISKWQLLEEDQKILYDMLVEVSVHDVPIGSGEHIMHEPLPVELSHWPIPCIAKFKDRFTLCCENSALFHPLIIADDIGQLLSCHDSRSWSEDGRFVITFPTLPSLKAMFSTETIVATLKRSVYCFEVAVPAGLRAGLLCPVSYKFICDPDVRQSRIVEHVADEKKKREFLEEEEEEDDERGEKLSDLILENKLLKDVDRLVHTIVKVVSAWRENPPYDGWRPRALVFCENVKHAFNVMDALERRQLEEEDVDDLFGQLSKHAKFFVAPNDRLGLFKNRNVMVPDELFPCGVGITLVCDKANEGVDIPECDVLVLARPTDNMIIYLQQLGRGLRRDPKQPNKKLLVIDMAGNIYRMWFIQKAVGDRRPSTKLLNRIKLVPEQPLHEESSSMSAGEEASEISSGSEEEPNECSALSDEMEEMGENGEDVLERSIGALNDYIPTGKSRTNMFQKGPPTNFSMAEGVSKIGFGSEDSRVDGFHQAGVSLNLDENFVDESGSRSDDHQPELEFGDDANDDDFIGFVVPENPGGQSDFESLYPEGDEDYFEIQNVETEIEEKLKRLEIDTENHKNKVSDEYIRLFCESEQTLLDAAALCVEKNCNTFDYQVAFKGEGREASFKELNAQTCSWFGMMGIPLLVSCKFLQGRKIEFWGKLVEWLWGKSAWIQKDLENFSKEVGVEKTLVLPALNHIWWIICSERYAFQRMIFYKVFDGNAEPFFRHHLTSYLKSWGNGELSCPMPSVAWALLKNVKEMSVLDMFATGQWWLSAAEYFGARDISLIHPELLQPSEWKGAVFVKRSRISNCPFSFFIGDRSCRFVEDDVFEDRNKGNGDLARRIRFANSNVPESMAGFECVVSFPPTNHLLDEKEYSFLLQSRDWSRFIGGNLSQLGIQSAILHLLVSASKVKRDGGVCFAFVPAIALCQRNHCAALSWILGRCDFTTVMLLPNDALGLKGVWRMTCLLMLNGRKIGSKRVLTSFVKLNCNASLCESILQLPSLSRKLEVNSSKDLREHVQGEFQISFPEVMYSVTAEN